jgi:forkhead box protein K
VELPKPDVMPSKPQLTYAQICYRALKALGGRAPLQDILGWCVETYDWFKYNEKAGWEVLPTFYIP